ncbi:PucR family transcriptional regulator [Actinokineospora iranica]|uniref:PucR C-terminal helix-turn-helix domain-containing protein n=1 Tax=Actinokineospora iranica TaxID=1271860 RepID=A0A1G6Z9H4_9PSEU|nr:PucR family transcriptional regulator [Actinokineospora iranica]SDD99122.1 PucR C-terminal helix-turn-helix domain-containing protein [Actinokineospora iranica]
MAVTHLGGPARDGGHDAPLPTPGVTALPIWASVVPELAERMRPLAGTLVQDAVEAIQDAVPAYRQPLEGKFREVLVGSVQSAIMQCFEFIANPSAPRDDWLAMFRYAGRVEFGEGRTMDSLQTAVRVGARAVWRHVSKAGQELGIPADTLLTVAEAIFAYVDDMCVVAVAGYTEAQAQATGSYERRRRQLLKLILSDPPATSQSLVDLAAAADWPVPAEVAVVVLEYRADQHHLPVPSLGKDVLIDLESGDPCLVLPDPATQLAALEAELQGRLAAVGPTVPLTDAHRSQKLARQALSLVHRGVLPEVAVTHCDRNLSTLLMFADESLVSHVAQPIREAFADLTDKQRDRVAGTLRTWLHTRGDINETASRLAVHPQTVRYRMNQIEELLGDRLNDPEQRFLMEITMHAWRLPDEPEPEQQI